MDILLHNNSITLDQNKEFMNAFISGEIKLLSTKISESKVEFLYNIRKLATCARHQIASSIYVNNSLISIGYNTAAISTSSCSDLERFLMGEGNKVKPNKKHTDQWTDFGPVDSDDYRNLIHPTVRENEIHAEAMAISGLAKRVEVLFKDTALDIDIYITKFPCINCANTIYAELQQLETLRRVNIYYLEEWANTDCSIINTLDVFKQDFRIKLFRLSNYI